MLLANVQVPSGIAVDGKNVYWASYEIGPVGAVPIAGGPSTTLDDVSATTIAIDATRVYTVSPSGGNAPQGFVVACDKTGCGGNPTTLASGQTGVWGVAVDGTNVYWTAQGEPGATPGVFKAPLAGGSPTALATGVSATSIAVGGGNVYFSGVGANGHADLMMVPVSGGAPSTLVDDPNGGVAAIATDCASVYFAISDGTIAKMPLGGGPSTTLASNAGSGMLQLAIDAEFVYWADTFGGAIHRVDITGGRPVSTLATGQTFPIGVAVDDNYVYWANRDGMPSGSIMKVSK